MSDEKHMRVESDQKEGLSDSEPSGAATVTCTWMIRQGRIASGCQKPS